MKTIGFAWILLTIGTLAAGTELEYSGQFEEVYWDGKPCEQVLQTPEYRLNLKLSDTSNAAEIRFTGFDQEGFLHGKKLEGTLSENTVLTAFASLKLQESVLKLSLEGQKDDQSFFFDLKTTVIGSNGKIVCRGRGTFTAFKSR